MYSTLQSTVQKAVIAATLSKEDLQHRLPRCTQIRDCLFEIVGPRIVTLTLTAEYIQTGQIYLIDGDWTNMLFVLAHPYLETLLLWALHNPPPSRPPIPPFFFSAY